MPPSPPIDELFVFQNRALTNFIAANHLVGITEPRYIKKQAFLDQKLTEKHPCRFLSERDYSERRKYSLASIAHLFTLF